MANYEFQSSDVAFSMAKQLMECPRYEAILSGLILEQIAFIHAAGKKKPKSNPSPAQIKAQSPLQKAISPHVSYVVVLYDEWFDWPEAKQYAALLEQLLMIETIEADFEDGKLRKYDVVALNFMVNNFGLHWAAEDNVKHPIEDEVETEPATRTFSGATGRASATESQAVERVFHDEDLDDLDEALGEIPPLS